MEAYIIESKHGEFILWTVNHIRSRAIDAFVEMKGQTWQELIEDGYRVCKVEIRKVVE